MAEARRATTVMLLRDGSRGLEVFMVQRHRRSGFLPDAWVFPGGRVDPGDFMDGHPRILGGRPLSSGFDVPHDLGVATGVAGVRETFEEAGIWLGEGDLPDTLRWPLHAGEVSLAEVLETHDTTVSLDGLVPWSWWVTPQAEPKRYDTRFLAAVVGDVEGAHDEHEVVDSRWISVNDVANGIPLEDLPLAPPTWWTLRELAALEKPADGVHAAVRPANRAIQPIMDFQADGLRLYLPGHPEHGDDPIEGVPDRITFDAGQWVAWRGDTRI